MTAATLPSLKEPFIHRALRVYSHGYQETIDFVLLQQVATGFENL